MLTSSFLRSKSIVWFERCSSDRRDWCPAWTFDKLLAAEETLRPEAKTKGKTQQCRKEEPLMIPALCDVCCGVSKNSLSLRIGVAERRRTVRKHSRDPNDRIVPWLQVSYP